MVGKGTKGDRKKNTRNEERSDNSQFSVGKIFAKQNGKINTRKRRGKLLGKNIFFEEKKRKEETEIIFETNESNSEGSKQWKLVESSSSLDG